MRIIFLGSFLFMTIACNRDSITIRVQEKGGSIINLVAADSTTSSCNAPSWITNELINLPP